MNDKYIGLLFLSIWVIMYYVVYDYFILDYLQIKHINIIQNQNLLTNKFGDRINFLFIAKLEGNKSCHIDILNKNIIKNLIFNIENNNQIYYTAIQNQAYNRFPEQINICSNPQTLIGIIFEKIIVYVFLGLMSFTLIVVFIHLIFEFNELKKKYWENNLNESVNLNTEFEKKINWIEYV